MKDEADTHGLGRGSVGDVVLPGGQRQSCLVELHKDREQRCGFGLVYLFTHSIKKPWKPGQRLIIIIPLIYKAPFKQPVRYPRCCALIIKT